MFIKKSSLFLLFVVCCLSTITHAMVFDNRFLPLLQHPRFNIDGTHSCFMVDFKMSTGSEAYSSGDQTIGIPELSGILDLGVLSDAIDKVGLVSPLRPDWKGSNIWFKTPGKIQSQMVSLFFHQKLFDWLHVGTSCAFMRTNVRHDFKLDTGSGRTNLLLTPADVVELEQNRVQMFDLLGINSGHTTQSGFGDIDLWLRFGHLWDYSYKFRSIDAGLRVGVLIPTGQSKAPNISTTIPFGGNGHWGVYATLESLFELKEDMKFGVFVRVSKRFEKTRHERMACLTESDLYGAIFGPVKIDPGFTAIISPYLLMENLREGLALSVQYTVRAHQEDLWNDVRADKTIPTNLQGVRDRSNWSSEYFSLHVLYDFGRVRVLRDLAPVLTVRWDVPSNLFATKRVVKAHQVSLGLEFAF